MRLCRFTPPAGEEALEGELRDGRAIAFDGGTVLGRLGSGDRSPATGRSWPLDEVRLEAPIAAPRQIFCVGLNYADHAAEAGEGVPETPSVFTKPGSASTAPAGPVLCPAVVRRLDYEAELAVVLGPGSSPAGFAVANDVTGRDLQKRERHWTRAKGADTFCPWGPWITTADELPDPYDLRIRSWVNGELRQDESTSQMIFGIDQVIGYIGEACTLHPGDLLLTGTPAGVGFAMDPAQFLGDGDTVTVEIEELGRIEHVVRSA